MEIFQLTLRSSKKIISINCVSDEVANILFGNHVATGRYQAATLTRCKPNSDGIFVPVQTLKSFVLNEA